MVDFAADSSRIKQAVATSADVPTSAVELTATAGSVNVVATITVPYTKTAESVSASLSDDFSSAEAATTFIGGDVVVQTTPVVRTPGGSSSGGGSGAAIGAAVGGGIVLLIAIGVAVKYCRPQKPATVYSRPQKPATVYNA